MLYIVSRVAPPLTAAARRLTTLYSRTRLPQNSITLVKFQNSQRRYSTDYVQPTATKVLTVVLSCSKIIYVEM